jgi:hypothetical protein
MHSILKSAIKPIKSEMVNVKLTKAERKLLQMKADKYTGGNVSEWLRYAGMNLDPRAQDLVTVK